MRFGFASKRRKNTSIIATLSLLPGGNMLKRSLAGSQSSDSPVGWKQGLGAGTGFAKTHCKYEVILLRINRMDERAKVVEELKHFRKCIR
jgi:hypothetical protein